MDHLHWNNIRTCQFVAHSSSQVSGHPKQRTPQRYLANPSCLSPGTQMTPDVFRVSLLLQPTPPQWLRAVQGCAPCRLFRSPGFFHDGWTVAQDPRGNRSFQLAGGGREDEQVGGRGQAGSGEHPGSARSPDQGSVPRAHLPRGRQSLVGRPVGRKPQARRPHSLLGHTRDTISILPPSRGLFPLLLLLICPLHL